MKAYYLFCILVLTAFSCAAQQTVERKEKLYNNITEKYHVLADSPEVKHGLYQAFFNKKTAIASGQYLRGKKTGVWHFYNSAGKVLQHYNYDAQKVLYEAREDTTSAIRYMLDDAFTSKDTVVKAIKAGGTYYGYLPYLKNFVLPPDLNGANTTMFNAVVELLVSPGGRLAGYKIRVVSPIFQYNKAAKMNPDILAEEDKVFIPAMLNGKPVAASIFITCRITGGGKLEY
ncbi:MAG: hypothetical protein ABIN95_00845 [Mucilaginibacter sp.]